MAPNTAESSADPIIIGAAENLATWRARKWARGNVITLADMIDECRRRWPWLLDDQISAVIAACDKPRGER